jgi:hypothetical protein
MHANNSGMKKYIFVVESQSDFILVFVLQFHMGKDLV